MRFWNASWGLLWRNENQKPTITFLAEVNIDVFRNISKNFGFFLDLWYRYLCDDAEKAVHRWPGCIMHKKQTHIAYKSACQVPPIAAVLASRQPNFFNFLRELLRNLTTAANLFRQLIKSLIIFAEKTRKLKNIIKKSSEILFYFWCDNKMYLLFCNNSNCSKKTSCINVKLTN